MAIQNNLIMHILVQTTLVFYIFGSLLVADCVVYSGTVEIVTMCSGPFGRGCDTAEGWYAWCDDHWDSYCCFRVEIPYTMTCEEQEPCKYVCCDFPQTPCGYKNLNPNSAPWWIWLIVAVFSVCLLICLCKSTSWQSRFLKGNHILKIT